MAKLKEESAEALEDAVTEAVVESQAPAQPAPAPGSEGLSIHDLNTMLQIIGVVQARGAIKAEEMVVVGGLYSKLQKFLEASNALAAEQNIPAAPEEN
jgi:hypothetical protein